MERYFEIGNELIKSGGVIWDDHNGGFESKLVGLAALVLGDKVVAVGLHKADFFSLNRVYLKDGKVHLSADSVGGTLFPVNFKDLWDCINDYNDKQVTNKFSCGTLENVMSLEPVPVTVISMTIGEFNERVRITSERLAVAEELREVTADGPGLELTASGLSPEEANKQFISRRSGERVAALNELFEKDTKVIGTPAPEETNREAAMHRKVFGPVDFLPGDEDEIQEAYYREMLAKKETGVAPTEDLGKDIPFVAGYAGHKDPTKP